MITILKSFNYISAFITFACNYKCHYCINKYNGLYKYKLMTPKEWIKGLNRIEAREDLPITITGGEPTVYRGFYYMVNNVDKPMDLLTNGSFNLDRFMKEIGRSKFYRNAKYASIRFSYHPGYTKPLDLLEKVRKLNKAGYSVGVWAVDTGDYTIKAVRWMAKALGVDFRIKEYLDSTHGNYKYPRAVDGKAKACLCKGSELLIAPDGRLFRCHYDLYHANNSYGHILDKKIELPEEFMPCKNYGRCSPCDIKQKFNRFQETGHCSVEIKELE